MSYLGAVAIGMAAQHAASGPAVRRACSRHTDYLISAGIAGPGFRNRRTRLQPGA